MLSTHMAARRLQGPCHPSIQVKLALISRSLRPFPGFQPQFPAEVGSERAHFPTVCRFLSLSAIALSWLHRVEKGAGLLAPTRVRGMQEFDETRGTWLLPDH